MARAARVEAGKPSPSPPKADHGAGMTSLGGDSRRRLPTPSALRLLRWGSGEPLPPAARPVFRALFVSLIGSGSSLGVKLSQGKVSSLQLREINHVRALFFRVRPPSPQSPPQARVSDGAAGRRRGGAGNLLLSPSPAFILFHFGF